jgi:hypothetical protein
MDNIVPVIDHASRMSDRWLFIAMIAICGIIVYAVGRIAINQIHLLLTDLKEERKLREEFAREVNKHMLDIIGRLEKIAQRSNDVIENNTNVMKEVLREFECVSLRQSKTNNKPTDKVV